MATDQFLKGDKQLIKNLEKLGLTVGNRVVRRAANSAMGVMVKAAKAKCPKDTGTLKKSLGKKAKTYKNNGITWVAVGPRTGFETIGEDGKKNDPNKYAHLVEKGTYKTKAQPFLRPAFDETKGKVLKDLEAKIKQGIQREAEKLKK